MKHGICLGCGRTVSAFWYVVWTFSSPVLSTALKPCRMLAPLFLLLRNTNNHQHPYIDSTTVLPDCVMTMTHFILCTWWWLTGVRQVRMLRLQLKETRAVKGTQWWQRKSLVYTAVQVEQCSGLTVWTVQVSSWNCDCDIPHFYTCTPNIHMQLLFYEHSRWPLSTVFSFALGHPILLRSWPPYSSSKWQYRAILL